MQAVVVTGANGFAGQHLVKELKVQGFSVIATGTGNNLPPVLEPYVDVFVGNCDLTKPENIKRLPLRNALSIINLAGLAQVGSSFGKEDLYNETNVNVHTLIAERLLEEKLAIRMVSISTGAVYDGSKKMPLTEQSPLLTTGSPYALSKIYMENALKSYIDRGVEVVVVRPFNHIGPGQLPGFLIPDLYKQINQAKVGNTPLRVGNLRTMRDFTDVRDVVKAYVKISTIEKSSLKHRVYNVCSGVSKPGTKVLNLLLTACNAKGLEVEVDPAKLRRDDVLNIYGSYERLFTDTGWKPLIPIEQTIKDFVQAEGGA